MQLNVNAGCVVNTRATPQVMNASNHAITHKRDLQAKPAQMVAHSSARTRNTSHIQEIRCCMIDDARGRSECIMDELYAQNLMLRSERHQWLHGCREAKVAVEAKQER